MLAYYFLQEEFGISRAGLQSTNPLISGSARLYLPHINANNNRKADGTV